MGPTGAFFSRLTRRRRIALASATVVALLLALAAASLSKHGGTGAPEPSASDGAESATAPATGEPPEAGGQADVIPPDEGADDQN